MTDSFHNDQFYILYQMEKWHLHRGNQNLFIDYKSWSGIFQTLSMFVNQANIKLTEVLFLTPIQIDAVEYMRSGVWAECINEYIYENFSVEPWIQEMSKRKLDFDDTFKKRRHVLYRSDNQPPIRLVIILNAEQINVKTLEDINEYLHCQTVVCFDSTLFCPSDSIIYKVKKPIKHYFLNEDASNQQKFLYSIMEKRLIPLSKDPEIKVSEYTKTRQDISKLPRPLISCDTNYDQSKIDNKLTRGDLHYVTKSNWRYSLEEDRYFLHEGIYVTIDSMSRKEGILRVTSHPTYTSYKFKVVPNAGYQHVQTPHLVDNLPIWRFARGGIIVPKVLRSYMDAKRIYAAVGMFEKSLQFFIIKDQFSAVDRSPTGELMYEL